ncbi:glycosyltransferase family 1 protein [Daejeonella sp.]|uniref:glycosyltransferase family 4 protein n=1 Tax=Daejeonella sp. TaxID=2805397 RepID=UPI0030BDBB3F
MKIGFDGKRTTQNLTGLGNYSRYIIQLLAKFYPENHYTIYALKPPSQDLTISGIEYQYPKVKWVKSYWRSYGVVKDLVKQKIDLFHGLSNEIPHGLKKAGIPSVVTIHDLIFIRYPQYYSFIDRIIYKLKFLHAALHADKVIAISQQTKQDLVEYFGINEDRIKVIYQNCDPIFRQTISQTARNTVAKKHSLPRKYLLNVGTIEERKNLMLIVKALTKIEAVHLVVVGKETGYIKKVKDFIAEHNLTERVHFLKNVAHADLPAVYQQAELFIYPSRFEGFGIPIIEALHSGVPVIAATGSCLEEAGGPGSIYVDPDDATDLAKQISDILENSEKRTDMINAGREYLEKFEDKKIADQMLHFYQNVLDNA